MLSFLENSVDNHIHCCPHINKRSTNIFEVVEHAENNKMYAIGLMDNFSNTSGYESLIRKYFSIFLNICSLISSSFIRVDNK